MLVQPKCSRDKQTQKRNSIKIGKVPMSLQYTNLKMGVFLVKNVTLKKTFSTQQKSIPRVGSIFWTDILTIPSGQ